MGLAVGISIKSCLPAEIKVISYLLPVNDCHLKFPTYPLVGYSNLNSRSALPDKENLDTAVGISFQSCIRAEIQDSAFVLPVDGGHL